MYVLCYFLTHRAKNMCVHRTPRCKVLYVISEILCVKYALLCVFGNTGRDLYTHKPTSTSRKAYKKAAS